MLVNFMVWPIVASVCHSHGHKVVLEQKVIPRQVSRWCKFLSIDSKKLEDVRLTTLSRLKGWQPRRGARVSNCWKRFSAFESMPNVQPAIYSGNCRAT